MTSIFGGKRVPKSAIQIEAIGAVDEASSFLGFALGAEVDKTTRKRLSDIQHDLYQLMGYLAGVKLQDKELMARVSFLEKEIDCMEKALPKLTRFILPQGSEASVRLHLARVAVRRAERQEVHFLKNSQEKLAGSATILQYLNRLSDYLFVLARTFNRGEKIT